MEFVAVCFVTRGIFHEACKACPLEAASARTWTTWSNSLGGYGLVEAAGVVTQVAAHANASLS